MFSLLKEGDVITNSYLLYTISSGTLSQYIFKYLMLQLQIYTHNNQV